MLKYILRYARCSVYTFKTLIKDFLTMLKTKIIDTASGLAWIDEVYAAIQKIKPDFHVRETQINFSKEIFNCFTANKVLVAEAPTGTGKTLAYLIGAQAYKLFKNNPVVIATATKLLQEQVLTKDLPLLVACGAVELKKVGLAKGKSNFLCIKNLIDLKETLLKASTDPEVYLTDDEISYDTYLLDEILEQYSDDNWDGDFDRLESRKPSSFIPIAVNGDTCKNLKCEYYGNCAYFKRKLKLTKCDLIITNHDLLLRDLSSSLTDAGGVFPFETYTLVLDEGHHLSDKALRLGSATFNVDYIRLATKKYTGLLSLLKKSKYVSTSLKIGLTSDFAKIEDAKKLLFEALKEIDTKTIAFKEKTHADSEEEILTIRFKKGVLPLWLELVFKEIFPLMDVLNKECVSILKQLSEGEEACPSAEVPAYREMISRSLDIKKEYEEALKFCTMFLAPVGPGTEPMAKWVSVKNNEKVIFEVSPLDGSQILKTLLWTSGKVPRACITSATLRDTSGFASFDKKTGLPKDSKHMVLPYSFDYSKSNLKVEDFKHSPKLNERAEFIKEVKSKLPGLIDKKEGCLVICPSWAILKEIVPALKLKLGEAHVKVQGAETAGLLLKKHCFDLDSGKGSVLVGVASFSEGLDLPGKYCTHVVVVALPFAVPTDPVEQEIADLLGSKYFSEKSLPDAAIKLMQITGRLIRRHTDTGKITVLDHRLSSTSYGVSLIKLLPPYTRVD